MMQQMSLREAELKVFKTAHNDGLWDIFLGSVIMMFAIAPFLSASMGDFWSSAVFVPVWAVIFLTVCLTRRYVVRPRIGFVEFREERKARMEKFAIIMLYANSVVFFFGLMAAVSGYRLAGHMYSIIFGMFAVAGFSTAAYFLKFSRLYLYGFMIGLSPFIGELLFLYAKVPHHGYPVTFGITALVMFVIGFKLFINLVRKRVVPDENPGLEELHNG